MATMIIRTYGVRGIVASPGPKTVKYGGNTPCIGLRDETSNDIFIFDAGTGIRKIGEELSEKSIKFNIHLFLTHTHTDHIEGLPLFIPLFTSGVRIHIYGPKSNPSLEETIGTFLSKTYNPTGLGKVKALIKFHELERSKMNIGELTFRSVPLNHSIPVVGYRLESGKAVFSYMTDHEPPAELKEPAQRKAAKQFDEDYLAHIEGADLLIADTQYMPDEIKLYAGWGHPSIHYVVNAALKAKVKRLVLFHHEPNRTDDQIDEIVHHYRNLILKKKANLEIIAGREVEEFNVHY